MELLYSFSLISYSCLSLSFVFCIMDSIVYFCPKSRGLAKGQGISLLVDIFLFCEVQSYSSTMVYCLSERR